MKINRKEAIKRTAVTMGGLTLMPGVLGILKGCTLGSLGSVGEDEIDERVKGNDRPSDRVDNDDNNHDDDNDHDENENNGHSNDEDSNDDNENNNESNDANSATYNSVSELRNTPGKKGEIAILSGYYAANDGGGTDVYWDQDSTEDDDGGMIFKVDGFSTGRWKRHGENYINVKWFGAKGDGVFRRGNDNEVYFFDKCLNWITKNNVKKIYVPKGVYILEHGLKTRIDSNHNGLELYGDGKDSELKFSDQVNENITAGLWMISWAPQRSTGLPIENMYIHDLKFNGNRKGHKIPMAGGNTGYALWINGQPNLPKGQESKNIRIERIYTCNHNTSGFSIRTSNTIVKDCQTWGHFQHGIETHNDAKNVIIDGLKAWQCGNNITHTGYGVDFSSGENLKLTNFDVFDCWAGFKTSHDIKSVEITNGYFRNNWGRGIQQTSTPDPNYTLKIDKVVSQNNPGGNRFDNMKSLTIGTFTSINDGDKDHPAILINNNVRKLYADSIEIKNSKGMALRVFSPETVINYIKINGAVGTGVQGRFAGNNVTINGGIIENVDGYLVHARGSNSLFKLNNMQFVGSTAIRVDSGSVVRVADCDFRSVVTNYSGGGTVSFID